MDGAIFFERLAYSTCTWLFDIADLVIEEVNDRGVLGLSCKDFIRFVQLLHTPFECTLVLLSLLYCLHLLCIFVPYWCGKIEAERFGGMLLEGLNERGRRILI